MSEGALSPGDILPDLSLFSLDGGVVKLRKTGVQVLIADADTSYKFSKFVKVILASSYS